MEKPQTNYLEESLEEDSEENEKSKKSKKFLNGKLVFFKILL